MKQTDIPIWERYTLWYQIPKSNLYRFPPCKFYTVRKHGYAWRRSNEKSHDDNGTWSFTEYHS